MFSNMKNKTAQILIIDNLLIVGVALVLKPAAYVVTIYFKE